MSRETFSLAPWLQVIEVPVLVLTSPAFLIPTTLPRAWVVGGLLVGLVTWAAARATAAGCLRHTVLNGQILMVMVMVLPATYASCDLRQSLPRVTALAFGAMLYVSLVVRLQAKSERVVHFTRLFALSGLGLALVGLVGTQWSSKAGFISLLSNRLPHLIRSVPNYYPNRGIHPNELAGLLLLFVPLLCAITVEEWKAHATVERFPYSLARDGKRRGIQRWSMAWLTGKRNAWLWSAAAAVVVGTLVLTQSRSALLGLGLATALWGAWSFKWLRPGPMLAPLLFFVYLVVSGTDRAAAELFGSSEIETAIGNLSLAGRVEAWQRAIYMLQNFSYTGVGLNLFPYVVQTLYPFFSVDPGVLVPSAHNAVLQAGVDFGIPGMMAYVGLVTAFLVVAARTMTYKTAGAERHLAAGLFFGMVAYQLFGLADVVALGARPGFVFWVMLALGSTIGVERRDSLKKEAHDANVWKTSNCFGRSSAVRLRSDGPVD